MKTKSITLIIIFLTCFSLYGQNIIENVLDGIEKNNTGLIALKKKVEADKIGNRTGIFLSNPEFGFNYLFGNPAENGNRNDISIKQTFDFPATYAYKSRIADSRNIQAELEYRKQLNTLLYQARLLCIDLLHTNVLKNEYDKRLSRAHSIASSYKIKLDKGESGILEYNKAQLNLLNIQNEVENNNVNRIALLSELAALNGGIAVNLDETVFTALIIPDDFENWYLKAEQNNPVLSWLKQEIEIMKTQRKLNIAMSLPKLSAGYMSEKVIGQQFQGITAGVSIPLWENKNTVKYITARSVAVQSMESDSKLVFYNQLKARYAKVKALQKTVEDYRISLELLDNSVLLKKSLDLGEISLTDYFFEISLYYESTGKLLEAEKELYKTFAVLNQYSR
ncbi:MAG: transporter [Odoribacter sp.]|nr:transporter [Odoribacter sp.]